jgi:hypothetical protein
MARLKPCPVTKRVGVSGVPGLKSETWGTRRPARGEVRHRDHKTIDLVGWHRVYMNRERFARHAPQIAFLD